MIVEAAIAGVTVCFVASLRFARWAAMRFDPESKAAEAEKIRALYRSQRKAIAVRRAILKERRAAYVEASRIRNWRQIVAIDDQLDVLAKEEAKIPIFDDEDDA